MMGDRMVARAALFYEFSLERRVPADHLLRAIDRLVDLEGVRAHVAPYYSSIGRPSIDPELLIRMLRVGYCFGIRSARAMQARDIAALITSGWAPIGESLKSPSGGCSRVTRDRRRSGRRKSRARGALISSLTLPLAAMTRIGDKVGVGLIRASR